MQSTSRFRMTGKQHRVIWNYLNTIEAAKVLVGICGSGSCSLHDSSDSSYSLTGKIYVGSAEQVNPYIGQLKEDQALAVFHKETSDHEKCFSEDTAFFSYIGILHEEKYRCMSIFLEGNQKCMAFIFAEGHWQRISITCISGADISFGFLEEGTAIPELSLRTAQAFGKATTGLLSKLTIGVVGVSGTGSIVAEQLSRLGVKKLVLVDDDVIETKNLNRILNSTMADADAKVNKAEMFAKAIEKVGLPTDFVILPTVVGTPKTIRFLSQCDILFGCMDSVDGRYHLNRLAAFYSIPYFDLGVKLAADGQGGIDEISGAIHYLQPDGSSLLSRRVFNAEALAAAALKRDNHDEYRRRLEEKYIVGARENSPAVISINMLVASMAVNDMLARIHPYREDPNDSVETIRIDLTGLRFRASACSEPCKILAQCVGKGDQNPILDMPALSEVAK